MAPLSFLHLQGPGRCRAGKTIHKESEMLAMITPRIEKIRQNYVNAKPQISCERAAIWTESYQTTEGQPACIRADRKSTRLNSSHPPESRMPSSA